MSTETMECKKSTVTTLKTDRRFEPTKTGLIGLQRDTMLSSELQFLVRERIFLADSLLIYIITLYFFSLNQAKQRIEVTNCRPKISPTVSHTRNSMAEFRKVFLLFSKPFILEFSSLIHLIFQIDFSIATLDQHRQRCQGSRRALQTRARLHRSQQSCCSIGLRDNQREQQLQVYYQLIKQKNGFFFS